VEYGLDFLDAVGMDAIHSRVGALTAWLMEKLVSLLHGNGERVARIYGPVDSLARGGTIAMNLYDSRGIHIDHRIVEERAAGKGISLRTGCFCNPGAGEVAMGLAREEIVGCLVQSGNRMTLNQFQQCIDGKSTGAVRISFGIASNYRDALRALSFFKEFREG
jgi:selenocysteine lyase/cysteine desulfurase